MGSSMGSLCDYKVKSPLELKSISVAIGTELKSMIVTGVLPCLINTVGTGDIAFYLLMKS